jgi:hypothetical protein
VQHHRRRTGSGLPARPNPSLAEHADAIRTLGKQTVENVIEIGRRLTECKRIVGHGNWLPWLEREFGWSERTARRFMQAHEFALAKSDKLADLNIGVSSLCLLAAPSTPKEAADEIIERAKAGEPVPVAETKRIIEDTKGRQEPSSKTRKGTTTKPAKPKPGDADAALKPAHDRAARGREVGWARRQPS